MSKDQFYQHFLSPKDLIKSILDYINQYCILINTELFGFTGIDFNGIPGLTEYV